MLRHHCGQSALLPTVRNLPFQPSEAANPNPNPAAFSPLKNAVRIDTSEPTHLDQGRPDQMRPDQPPGPPAPEPDHAAHTPTAFGSRRTGIYWIQLPAPEPVSVSADMTLTGNKPTFFASASSWYGCVFRASAQRSCGGRGASDFLSLSLRSEKEQWPPLSSIELCIL